MATAYGYGGEFSSDEDIDKIEQQNERKVQSRFDHAQSARPSKREVEEAIETIKKMPMEQDVIIADELIAGLLDYFKIQRGPIVDSTRKLYKKIILRTIRSESVNSDAASGKQETNGHTKNNNNNNNNNNNDINVIIKRTAQQQQQVADSFSSDDDEPTTEVKTGQAAKKFDGRVAYDSENDIIDVEHMDVDSETPTGPTRESKQIDISTTEDEDSEEEDEAEEEDELSDSLNSESEALEVTPIKAPAGSKATASTQQEVSNLVLSATPKPNESTAKRQLPLAQSTPKESILESGKKPFTRSQRMAAARSAVKDKAAGDCKPANVMKTAPATRSSAQAASRVSRRKYVLLTVTLLMVILAFGLYYYRANLIKSTEPLFS